MKRKIIMAIVFIIFCTFTTGCSKDDKAPTQTQEVTTENDTTSKENIESEEQQMEKKLILTVNDTAYDVTLYDTPSANALYEMLPLDLTFEDFNNIEKIAYLQETLPTENEPDGFEPKIGDLCLYEPWGNLSIFYKDFRYSDSLISLGHIDSGIEELSNMQSNFIARLEVKK